MKIAILGPLDLEYMGGGETNSMMMGNILSKFAEDVRYYGAGCPLENVPIEKVLDEIHFKYYPTAFSHDPMANPVLLKMSSLLSLGAIGALSVKRVLAQIRDCDVIFFSYPSLMARRIIPIATKQGKKVILANHGTFFEYFGNRSNIAFSTARRVGTRFLLKPLAKVNNNLKIHTQTSYQTEYYLKTGMSRGTIMEIPQNNVEFSKYSAGKPQKGFNVVFLGRITKSKGIKVLKEVIVSNPAIKFRVIGSGPMLKELMNSVRDANAEIYGYITDREKKDILSKSDLMIVPSHFDSLSIASIEGLASGLPLLVSNTAEGPKYIISKDGLFGKAVDNVAFEFSKNISLYASYKNQDPDGYYKDKLRRKQRASDLFDVNKIKEMLNEFLREFLSFPSRVEHENYVSNPPTKK